MLPTGNRVPTEEQMKQNKILMGVLRVCWGRRDVGTLYPLFSYAGNLKLLLKRSTTNKNTKPKQHQGTKQMDKVKLEEAEGLLEV